MRRVAGGSAPAPSTAIGHRDVLDPHRPRSPGRPAADMREGRAHRAWIVAASILWSIACAARMPAREERPARPWRVAERLFRRDPRWLGADAALSVPLGEHRTLWLFGDTFVALTGERTRAASRMVRNTVGVQTGSDPLTASMEFIWGGKADGSPASFFPDSDPRWYWPGHGIRLEEGPLVVFLFAMTPTPGDGLGFACGGYALAVIDDPDASAASWRPRVVDASPVPFDAIPATALIRDGGWVIALAIRQEGTHAGALVRYPSESLASGDTTQAEWWSGDNRGWLRQDDLGPGGPAFVLDDAGAECSVHRDPRSGEFIHVASYGFGASSIGVRRAPALTGPWSPPTLVYRPPESDRPRPFVYAAKAHPEQTGPRPGDLVITYAVNSFDFADLVSMRGERSLYWPRFIVVRGD